jgi:hypothetical protein
MIHNMKNVEVPQGSGQITVESVGDGPLVLCVPGMGESRSSFRHLLPGLAAVLAFLGTDRDESQASGSEKNRG